VSSEFIGGFQVVSPDFFVLPNLEGNFENLFKYSLDRTV
jgi:hypothetical protein